MGIWHSLLLTAHINHGRFSETHSLEGLTVPYQFMNVMDVQGHMLFCHFEVRFNGLRCNDHE